MMNVDLAVYNEHRELALAVEVKTLRGVTTEWASKLRRNLLAHGSYPVAKFFLLATPDLFFLWNQNDAASKNAPPSYTIEIRKELEPFFNEFHVEPNSVSGFVFEQIVGRWLKSIMYPAYRNSDEPLASWVTESGLEKAVFRGDFYFEEAA